jgi:hypothetical protein
MLPSLYSTSFDRVKSTQAWAPRMLAREWLVAYSRLCLR